MLASVLFLAGPPAAVGLYAWWRNTRRDQAPVITPETPSHREPHREPVELPDDDAVQPAACSCAAGLTELSEAQLRACVWASFYPAIAWPPVPGDHHSILQAADMVIEAVSRAKGGACAIDGEPVSPDEAKDAWDISKWFSPDAWPGHLYQVKPGDSLLGEDGIIARAIYRATYEHALGAGLSDDVAQQRAFANAADPGNRMAYLHAIQCGGWNAALYGSKVFSSKAVPSPNGLAIRALPYHAANYERIVSGLAPMRLLNVETGNGTGKALELLWLPPLVRAALLDMSRQIQVSTSGLVWQDGTSMMLPPPQIQALGMANVPANVQWGCP